jgi:hypothetical protein
LEPLALSSGGWSQSGQDIANIDTSGKADCLGRIAKTPGRDFLLAGDFAFAPRASAGVFFRSTMADDRLASGYLLRLHAQGVDLWRLDGPYRAPLQRMALALDPKKTHGLRVAVQGDKIAVDLDGQPVFNVRDRSPLTGEEAGLYAKGECRFKSLKIESK